MIIISAKLDATLLVIKRLKTKHLGLHPASLWLFCAWACSGERDQVFDEFKDVSNDRSPSWVRAIELQDTPENLILPALLPGIDRNDIDIHITREAVSIADRFPFLTDQALQ